eukprot:jgi/Botrbrau1/16482/Bobra.0142s0076.1
MPPRCHVVWSPMIWRTPISHYIFCTTCCSVAPTAVVLHLQQILQHVFELISAFPAMGPLARTCSGVSTSGRTPDVTWRGVDAARHSKLRCNSFVKGEPALIGSHRRAEGRQRLIVDVTAAVAVDLTPSVGPGKNGRVSSLQESKTDKLDFFYTESGQKEWVSAMELQTLTPELPQLLREIGVKYDPDRLAQVLSSRKLEIGGRAVRVAAVLGGFVATLFQDFATGQLENNTQRRAIELRNLLGSLGPSFVKIGQALASRPDLLPQPYLESLSMLQDRLQSFPTPIALAVIEEELGCPVSEVFSELSPEPIAAASLGQVYRGRLRSTGEEVAVKVQRPGIGESIALDMLLLRRLMMTIDNNLHEIGKYKVSQPLVPLVDEFASRLFSELDYVQEGHNCERFSELYGNLPRIRTPKIVWEYTRRRVLTMEWIEGVKLTNRAAMEARGLEVVDFVDVGIECTLRQLLDHGYFHADPHPGNLLATEEGDLVYLDFGMMSEAPQPARYAIIAHVVHLVNRDYRAMCQDYYTLDFMDRSVDTTPIAPALARFFDDVLDRSVAELNFKAIVDGLGEVMFQFPFRVPAYYALILRSLTVLEGLALQADPKYKLLGKCYPYMAKRLLTDPAPELRASLEELVLNGQGRLRWKRLENLVQEGSKSADYSPDQLWLLAEWLVSDAGRDVRGPIVREVARLLDAYVAEQVREGLLQRSGGPGFGE